MEEDATNGQIEISVVWRGKTIVLKENEGTKIAELGVKLKELTGVSQDTLRLLVPQTKNAAPTSLTPFSDVHAALTLAEAGISEGQPIRMMGVFFSEIQEVSQPATKIEERILGFEEEEIRAKQLTASETTVAWKLPQGPYIFCDFRALQIPGIVLHPPPEKALSLMQRLASDPGIVAIMNKHRWRVGIMTELAPVGYVGVSPKCVLGFNQNFGEEISLRLRTDDLKGFRKFESIKKTLLHELAHMVHSEHDAQFLALNKQLEEEAISLDWTKSHAYSLSGSSRKAVSFSSASHEDVSVKKLGGNPRHFLTNARASATAAAIHRIQTLTSGDLTSSSSSTGIKNSTVNQSETSKVSYKTVEPDTHTRAQGINISTAGKRIEAVLDAKRALLEPDDDNNALDGSMLQKFHINGDFNEKDCCVGFNQQKSSTVKSGADPVNPQGNKGMDKNEKLCHQDLRNGEVHIMDNVRNVEPDPDDCKEGCNASSRLSGETVAIGIPSVQLSVSDDANLSDAFLNSKDKGSVDSSSNSSNGMEMISAHVPSATPLETVANISNPSSCKGSEGTCCMKPNTESIHLNLECIDESLKRIQDSTVATCTHLREVIQQLKHQVPPLELTNVIKFLLTIVRNILDHPREEKFRRVRKANPVFQRNIAKYEGALKVLNAIGFIEDKMTNNVGTVEAFLILKRSDPGLLWLAYSILEAHMT